MTQTISSERHGCCSGEKAHEKGCSAGVGERTLEGNVALNINSEATRLSLSSMKHSRRASVRLDTCHASRETLRLQ